MKLELRVTKLPSARALCFVRIPASVVFFNIKAVTATSIDEPDIEMATVEVVEFGQGNGYGFDASGARNFTTSPLFFASAAFLIFI